MHPNETPPPPKPQVLRASLLGVLSLTNEDGAAVALKSKKAKAVLAYLLCSPDRRRTREHLAALFWSGSDEAHARASLRQAIVALRRDLSDQADEYLSASERDIVVLSDTLFHTDIDALRTGDAANHVNDGFLDDLAGLSEPFEDWRRWRIRIPNAILAPASLNRNPRITLVRPHPDSPAALGTAIGVVFTPRRHHRGPVNSAGKRRAAGHEALRARRWGPPIAVMCQWLVVAIIICF